MSDQSGSNPENARAALASVAEMQRAGARRGLPPRWFGVLIALWAGGLIAAVGVDEFRSLLWLPSMLLICAMAAMRKHLGAWIRAMGGGFRIGVPVLANLVVLGLACLSIFGGEKLGWPWAPHAAGVATAITIYGLFEYKRRAALAGLTGVGRL